MMGIQQVVDSVIQLDFERPLEGSCDFVMSEHDSNGASSALAQAMVCCVEDSPVTLITSTSESRIDFLHQCPPGPLFGKELLHVLHKYYVWPQARALLQDPLDAAPDEAPPGTSSTSTRRVFRAVILTGGGHTENVHWSSLVIRTLQYVSRHVSGIEIQSEELLTLRMQL